MIVNGFIEPLVKELPMEYAVEMNRLIQLQRLCRLIMWPDAPRRGCIALHFASADTWRS
ncbi:MAG: hypothetical protein R3C56_35790 [Pirellulaceae bacterium]